jgi:hypothetical protein
MFRRILKWGAIGVVGLFLLIQLVPYGRSHDNPPVTAEPNWDSAATRKLAVAACFDCHSNETEWPWYTNVAPMSWLIQHDVDEGRAALNFSEWNREQHTDDIAELIESGDMPPTSYRVLHSAARLTDAEKRRLIAGLERTLGRSGSSGEGSGGDDESGEGSGG